MVVHKKTLLFYVLVFDQLVQDSKKNSIEALAEVPRIKELIKEANEKTIRAQEALAGAESSAKNSRNIAQMAYEAYNKTVAEVSVETSDTQ